MLFLPILVSYLHNTLGQYYSKVNCPIYPLLYDRSPCKEDKVVILVVTKLNIPRKKRKKKKNEIGESSLVVFFSPHLDRYIPSLPPLFVC